MNQRGGNLPIDNVMLFSGGLDSTVLLYNLHVNGGLKALSVNYDQRHKKELDFARQLCVDLNVPWDIIDLSNVGHLIAKGSQSGTDPVPLGHYADESMKTTIVPNRNMIMLSIAVGHAITIGAHNVYFAAHSGDHAIYPDCRPEFVYALNGAIHIGNSWTPVDLWAPYIRMSKADIVKEGARLGVPFAKTWSCYLGGDIHCGRCGTCVERREAFVLAGVKDPTTYAE